MTHYMYLLDTATPCLRMLLLVVGSIAPMIYLWSTLCIHLCGILSDGGLSEFVNHKHRMSDVT